MTEKAVIGMAQGIKGKEPSGRDMYPDIIEMPHHQSPTRLHMSLYDRSAQFASYKALSGYEDMVAEEARLTDAKVELEEFELENLNQKLNLIADVIADGTQPTVTITYFVPDERKAGGEYRTVTETIKRVDAAMRRVVLTSTRESGLHNTIDFDRITGIKGALVDYMDDSVE